MAAKNSHLRWGVVAALAALVLIVVLTGIGGSDPDREPEPKRPVAEESSPIEGCDTTADDASMVPLDLPVQASTGDQDRPRLSRERVDREVAAAEAAGATVISTTASRTIDSDRGERRLDLRAPELVIEAARARGLQVRLRLDDSADWSAQGDRVNHPPMTEVELQRWTEYVRTVAQQTKGRVAYFEVWNEPNIRDSWSTGPDPAAFARLLDASYAAIKDVNPKAVVISGGLAGNDAGYLDALYAAIEQSGGQLPFDLVGVHPFSDQAPDAYDRGQVYERKPFGTYDGNFLGISTMQQVMSDNDDDGRGIYIGEFGYEVGAKSALTSAQVGDYAVLSRRAADCLGDVRALSWYTLVPTRWDPASWALLDRRLRPSDAYAALVRVARATP